MTSDSSVVRQFAFVRCLHCGNGAVLRPRNLDELLGTRLCATADIKMITDQQEKRCGTGKLTGTEHRVPITQRCSLFNELQPPTLTPGRGRVGSLVPRTNHDANFLNAGGENFLVDDSQGWFCHSVPIH